MKSGTETKVKFKKLQRRLKLPLWQAVGLLETLWQATIQNAICGDIGRLSDEDIAAALEWEGDESELIVALVECGWLDECDEHRLVVHDWEDHCPTFVRGNIAKHGKSFAKQRSKHPAKQRECDVAKHVAKQADTSVLPSQTKPNQTNSSQTSMPPSGGVSVESNGRKSYTDDFEDRFWKPYPKRNGKKVGKQNAFKGWRTLKLEDRDRVAGAVLVYAVACDSGQQLAKDPERFLKNRFWEDWLDPPEVSGNTARKSLEDILAELPEKPLSERLAEEER